MPSTCITRLFTYLLCNYVVAVGVESTTENTCDNEDSDWLHRNNTYEPMQIDNDDRCIILGFLCVPNTNYIFLSLYDAKAKVNMLLLLLYICR